MTTSPPTGLRERKKAKTRAAIREHAMRLFEEQGYAATTVEQIAEAADVSPSTFFRYFPTKEDTVLADDYDPLIVAELRAQPPEMNPIEAIRRSIHAIFDQISDEDWERERQRQRLFESVPELRARAMQQYLETTAMVGEVVAVRAGLPPDDFSARVLAGAVIGAAIAAVPRGMTAFDRGDFDRLDDALMLLQAGLPLGSRPASG
ncbi:MAG TPA: TetR family transcriptional regulator [Actinoplanes sp.]|jgi:AcrR family transcriptional regulator|nr:TetR family transcriptional regulator [Actinoplanes sp.]